MRKVNEQLREVVAEAVVGLKDPRIGFLTITGVECAPDLRRATVFYSVLGTEQEVASTAEALASASRKLQAAVASEVRLKYTPVLAFRVDPSIEQGSRISKILLDLEKGQEAPRE
jgi:ribosome-binding factor A